MKIGMLYFLGSETLSAYGESKRHKGFLWRLAEQGGAAAEELVY